MANEFKAKNGIITPKLESTVATGTAPLIVASTTAVTNLNADLLDGNHASAFATSGHTHNYLPLAGGTMTGAITFAAGQTWPTFNQNTTGSAATLTTARTLTIGSTGKTFNGSANVSWTLAEIGAYSSSNPSGFTSNTGTVTSITGGSYLTGGTITTSGTLAVDATSANTASKVVARDASGNFIANVISAVDFNSTSDAKLKENVENFEALSIINNINPIKFTWKDSGKKSYGVIAQELEKILPELVTEREDGFKGVSYIPMIAMLIDAVKTLDARVKELEIK